MCAKQDTSVGATNAPRICVLSQRHLERNLSRCVGYEFEDVISQIDDVEMLIPDPHRWFGITQKVAYRLARYPHRRFGITQKVANQLARCNRSTSFNPGIRRFQLNRNYDVFFAFCQSPWDVPTVNTVIGWKQRCQASVLWLEEIWAGELYRWKSHMKLLSEFDYVVIGCSGTIQLVQDAIHQSCLYMPAGVDALRFCPYPNSPHRCIDVYSMGRRSPTTHQDLLKMAEQKQIFYIYDTISLPDTFYPREHRNLIANMAKRSSYFLTYPAKVDRPLETHGQHELGPRYMEGAAAGTIMLGEAPANDVFTKYFDWPDAVINVPFDTSNIEEVLDSLNAQPERLQEIRRNNVVQSLLRHDWVYRWRLILDKIGLEARPALVAREQRLKKLAEDVRKIS